MKRDDTQNDVEEASLTRNVDTKSTLAGEFEGEITFVEVEFLTERIDRLGGPEAYNHYAVGWAHVMNTPYQWTKQVASHSAGRDTCRDFH